MKFIIIRHGEPDYDHDSVTEKGAREADLLAKKLVKEKIDYFYCSPLGRAKRTAKPTLDALGRTAEILDWAREMPCMIDVDYHEIGIDYKGRIYAWDMMPEYWTVHPEMYDPNNWYKSDVFKNCNLKERFDMVGKNLEELLARHGLKKDGHFYRFIENADKDVTVALFCHMGLGNCIISHLTGMAPPVVWHTVLLPTSSVTTFVFETFKQRPDVCIPRIVSIGDTSHLYAGNEPVSSSGLHCSL